MTTRQTTVIMVIIAIMAGTTGAMLGYRYCRSSTYQYEIRLHWVILARHDSKLEPGFREFVKARYYSFIRWAPNSSLPLGCLQDFGPVDETLLKGIPIGKGIVASEEYSCAKARLFNKGQ